MLVNQLDWNLNTPTSFDFFDQMVSRSPVLESMRDDFVSMVHKIQRGKCV